MPYNMKPSSRVRPLQPLLLFLLGVSVLAGCGQGYVVDKKKNVVTFETWDEGRGKVSTVLTNADAATFKLLKLKGPQGFARDKHRVYLLGIPVAGAHPESFRKLKVHGGLNVPGGGNYFYRDAQRVFIYPYSLGGWITMLPDSDPESFRVLTNNWSRDRTRVYYFESGFVPRDIASFKPLDRGLSQDNQAYYQGTNEIARAGTSVQR